MSPNLQAALWIFLTFLINHCETVIQIETSNTSQWLYLDEYGIPVNRSQPYISFSVRANNDAHIALSKLKDLDANEHTCDADLYTKQIQKNDPWTLWDAYEVIISGWMNSEPLGKSAIRKCIYDSDGMLELNHEVKPLNMTVFKPFWIAWPEDESRATHLSVGYGLVPYENVFLNWSNSDGHTINYIAITTGWNSEGTWIFGHVNGGWSEWSSWSSCSESCGPANRTRSRACDNPEPEYNGAECRGPPFESEDCELSSCAINGSWSSWNSWTDCSLTCGGGERTRQRTCSDPPPQFDGKNCTGHDVEQQSCNEDIFCPVDGSWSSWSNWSSCSETCGPGSQSRNRECNDPAPAYGGQNCTGNATNTRDCEVIKCPVHGNWSAWSGWSACSVSCNEGSRTRNRSCDNPAPAYNGTDCTGNHTQIEVCFLHDCPIDGGWSYWRNWSDCSSTCGNSTKTRSRTCDNPEPAYGGKNCTGPNDDTTECDYIPCPVHGGWGNWSEWGDCTVTCELGLQFRTRNCSNPTPMYGGDPCAGLSSENQTCARGACPIDGSWSPWSHWGECSATCSGGIKTRSRTCTNPKPMHNGNTCEGTDVANVSCSLNECRDEVVPSEDEEATEAEGAVTIGIIGVILCCSILGAVVVLDLATIHRHFAFMKRNVDDFLYRRGWRKTKPTSKRKRKSTRRSKTSSTADIADVIDTSQVEIRFDNDGRIRATMPPNNALNAQLDVNGLRGHGPSRFSTRNNLNTPSRKDFETRYHKALNSYVNLELTQTQL